jgi:4-amino-4-deoxy-L-arabinose transferase-like glycosyltransferase
MRPRPIATACVLAGLTLLLYAFRIAEAPISPAESVFNTEAQSVRAANTPVFFHADGERWLQPIAVYANAAMRTLGGEELSGRLVSLIAAALSVAMVFLLAIEISGRTWTSALAALLLMLTPAFWSFAQRGSDALIPVPLILLWLWNVLRFLKHDSIRSLIAAAAALGLCMYAHPSGPLTAGFLWMLTLIIARRRNLYQLFVSTIVLGAWLLPAAVWFLRHPDTYPDIFGRWVILAAHVRMPMEGVRAFFNTGTLGNRLSMYWGFWDPSWLFFNTRDTPAPFLTIAAPLIVLGFVRVRHLSREVAALIVGAALLAPLAGAAFGNPHYLADAAVVMPLAALFSALGVEQLFRRNVAVLVDQSIERTPADA